MVNGTILIAFKIKALPKIQVDLVKIDRLSTMISSYLKQYNAVSRPFHSNTMKSTVGNLEDEYTLNLGNLQT